jgi:uncharacterized RDD family membrane protein YckC
MNEDNNVPQSPDISTHQPVEVVQLYPAGMRPVGVWFRFLARMLDSFVIGFIGSPFLGVIIFISFRAGLEAGKYGTDSIKYTPKQSLVIGACSLAYLIITICYHVFLASSKMQGTIGKRILGFKIIDEKGGRISIGRAFTRYISTDGFGIPSSLLGNSTNSLGKGIAGVFGFLSVIYMIIDASVGGADIRKRTVHDRIAKTFVVYRQP